MVEVLTVDCFKIDPQAALKGAVDLKPAAVVIVCQSANGQIMVFSSEDTEKTLDLLERGPKRIDELSD